MNSGFSFFKLCAAVVFIIVGFVVVMERSNINKTAEVTGMGDVIEQTKRDFNNVTHVFKLNENKYQTTLGRVFKREYLGYTLYISCLHRGPLYGFMTLKKDNANLPRKNKFAVDMLVPTECRQISTSSYNRTYHRGHLFAANHFDNDDRQMWESFFMSNVVPQHHVSNTGAWKKKEVITECYREHHSIYLAAGVICGQMSRMITSYILTKSPHPLRCGSTLNLMTIHILRGSFQITNSQRRINYRPMRCQLKI